MLTLRGGADIVVATPGRLLDLVDHNALQLDGVAHLVLDEVDRLLDLGFMEELNRVLALLPSKRQNLWFSATFDASLQPLTDSMLRQSARVEIAGSASNEYLGEGFAPTDTPPPPSKLNDGAGGVKGRRPSKKDKLRSLKGL
jgi:ATP-dependent RNA helicase RhlE